MIEVYQLNSTVDEDKARWAELLSKSQYSNYLANYSYEQSRVFDKRELTTFIFIKNSKDIAGVHYSFKKSFAGLINTADILSGIVFTDELTDNDFEFVIDHFIRWAKENNASYIRLTSWLPAIIEDKEIEITASLTKTLLKKSFLPIIDGRSTYWLDIAGEEEALMSKMKRDTKYRIKQALKAQIEIVKYNKPDEDVINEFWNIYNSLGREKGFSTLSEAKFKHQIEVLLASNLAILFVVKYKNVIINISLSSKVGIASNLYGAINPIHSTMDGCPSPGHVVQWEIIKTLKAIGVSTYDLGFCPGPKPYPEHPRYSIWRFKYGFGGKYVKYQAVFGRAVKPVRGHIFQFIKYRK